MTYGVLDQYSNNRYNNLLQGEKLFDKLETKLLTYRERLEKQCQQLMLSAEKRAHSIAPPVVNRINLKPQVYRSVAASSSKDAGNFT